MGEAGGAELEDARGLASIEHVDHIKPKVSLQPLHVMICSMQYLHHRRVVKHRAQSLTQLRLQRERVHQKVFLPRTHLHQARYAQITARLMVLQIDSDLTLSCDSGYQLSQSVLVVHKSERSLIQRLCGLRLRMLVKRSVIVCFLQLLDLILVGVWQTLIIVRLSFVVAKRKLPTFQGVFRLLFLCVDDLGVEWLLEMILLFEDGYEWFVRVVHFGNPFVLRFFEIFVDFHRITHIILHYLLLFTALFRQEINLLIHALEQVVTRRLQEPLIVGRGLVGRAQVLQQGGLGRGKVSQL